MPKSVYKRDPKRDPESPRCDPEALPKWGPEKASQNDPKTDQTSQISEASNMAKTW